MKHSNRLIRRLAAASLATALAGALLVGGAFAHGPGSGPSPLRLMTEHAAGQNTLGRQSAGNGGFLDPAIAQAIRNARRSTSVPLITEHSAGQGAVGRQEVRYVTATPALSRALDPVGFNWDDAAVGAVVTLAIALSAVGLTAFAVRRRRSPAHA